MARREWPAWARASEILDLVRLSVPIAISRLAWMLMGLTDAIVLGQVAPDELPYILNAWLPIGVMLGFGMGILMGVQVLTAELGGRGQEADSGRIFRRGAVFALGLGIAMVAITYPTVESLFHWLFVTIAPPREAGDIPADLIVQEVSSATRILVLGMPGFLLGTVCSMYLEALRRPLLVTVVAYFMVAINLVFDLVLVAGWFGAPQLGADGVAIATTATRTASVFVFAVFIIWLTPGFRKSKPTPEGETRRQFEVGAGTAISNVAEWGGFNATYVIALWIAAHVNIIYGYASQLIGTAFMIFLGIGTATSVRVAEHVGRGNQLGVRESSRLGIAATVVSGIVLGAMILVFREQLASALVNRSA
ncbi:MAG: MATE family efflux transporter, partial [Pseudomonadota bacterium]